MEESLEDVIPSELSPDEAVLWLGRPPQGYMLRAADAFLIPFSLLWGGIAIFWETGVIATGAPWFFVAFGVPFVLIGLYIMVGRFWVDKIRRAGTYYAVTSERVIIVHRLLNRSVKSLNMDTLSDISLTEHRKGSGIITLGPASSLPMWHVWQAYPGLGQTGVPSLELAGDAREVYEIICKARRAARQGH